LWVFIDYGLCSFPDIKHKIQDPEALSCELFCSIRWEVQVREQSLFDDSNGGLFSKTDTEISSELYFHAPDF